jgi:hypothetical protein
MSAAHGKQRDRVRAGVPGLREDVVGSRGTAASDPACRKTPEIPELERYTEQFDPAAYVRQPYPERSSEWRQAVGCNKRGADQDGFSAVVHACCPAEAMRTPISGALAVGWASEQVIWTGQSRATPNAQPYVGGKPYGQGMKTR